MTANLGHVAPFLLATALIAAATPAVGDWSGIRFGSSADPGTQISQADIEFAGGNASLPGVVYAQGNAGASLDNVTFSSTVDHGTGVVIYSGATILGRITVGRGAVIGGNVWLTRSVAPGTVVTQQTPEQETFFHGGGI